MQNNPQNFFLLGQVIVPTLHISLGVYKRLYDLFELECHQLDVEILKERAIASSLEDEHDDNLTTNFDKKVADELSRKRIIAKDLEEKRPQLEDLEEDIPLLHVHDLHNTTGDEKVNRVHMLRADIAEMVCKHFFFFKISNYLCHFNSESLNNFF